MQNKTETTILLCVLKRVSFHIKETKCFLKLVVPVKINCQKISKCFSVTSVLITDEIYFENQVNYCELDLLKSSTRVEFYIVIFLLKMV